MKLQNLTVIFIAIILPIILIVSLYITTGIKTIKYQAMYDEGLLTATQDALLAYELNTANNELSQNPEIKRSIIKSSIKMFEKSLANNCNISSYSQDEIEEYIPAIVLGMYDGFYLYAPSYTYNEEKGVGEYKHNLKNYVYYSETLDDGTIISYTLDNYITVTTKVNNSYIVKEGYLSVLDTSNPEGTNYNGITINTETINGAENNDAINYYKQAYEFTEWFNNNVESKPDYLIINGSNDPEDENSPFVQHKRQIMKEKIEGVLNSTITAYSERTWGQNYKMPKFSVEDWEKIYSNISMTAFFQGKEVGFTKYNGYCVLNSTNSNEYVNPNLMYFIDNNEEYHDIRCNKCTGKLTGYRIGNFEKIKLDQVLDEEDTPITSAYTYKYSALACYECVNTALATDISVYDYIKPSGGTANDNIKTSYWTSLARERYNSFKLNNVNLLIEDKVSITYMWPVLNENGDLFTERKIIEYKKGDIINELEPEPSNIYINEQQFEGWKVYGDSTNTKIIGGFPIQEDMILEPIMGVHIDFYIQGNKIKSIKGIPGETVDKTEAPSLEGRSIEGYTNLRWNQEIPDKFPTSNMEIVCIGDPTEPKLKVTLTANGENTLKVIRSNGNATSIYTVDNINGGTTNAKAVKLEVKDKSDNVKLYIKDEKTDNDFTEVDNKEYTFEKGAYETINVEYYFITTNLEGAEERTNTKEFAITIDRKPPTIDEHIKVEMIEKSLLDKKDYKFSLQITDDSGINEVKINVIGEVWPNIGKITETRPMNLQNSYFTHTYDGWWDNNRKIQATDKLGNTIEEDFKWRHGNNKPSNYNTTYYFDKITNN